MSNINHSLMLREIPENERPREKIFSGGVRALSNAELIAVLLSSGSRNESSVSLASRVLSLTGGNLGSLSEMLPEEFMKIKGIGEAKACTLAAALELGRRVAVTPPSNKVRIESPESIASLFMEEMRHMSREILRVIMLNAKNEIIMREDVSLGKIDRAFAGPREVFSTALKKGAYSVIIAHNHPSGDPNPSAADLQLTKILKESGELLGIPLLDHIIIGDGRFISINEFS